MALCIDLGYQVVTDTETVTSTGGGDQVVTVTAPVGKKPISGGWDVRDSITTYTGNLLRASYPSGNDWVFVFNKGGVSNPVDVDLYVTCINT